MRICLQGRIQTSRIRTRKKVGERTEDVLHFWKTGVLNPASNVQFGEGGAGTFSDGKLNTLVKDPLGRNRFVLDTFVSFGAPEKITYENKPHIGTDILSKVIAAMREEILHLGGTFEFESCVTDIRVENQKIKAVEINHNTWMETEVCVLALGHSARDTFEMLHKTGLYGAKGLCSRFSCGAPTEGHQPQPVWRKICRTA